MKRVRSQFADITVNNPIVTTENPVIMPDMTLAWHKWTNRGLFNDEGELVEYQSVGRDITSQVRGEKAKMDLIFEITLLSDFTTGLLAIENSDQLYQYLGDYLKKTAPHSCIIIVSFSKSQGAVRVISQGTHWRNKKLSDYFENLIGKSFPCIVGVRTVLSPGLLSPMPPNIFDYPGISGTPFACLGRYLSQYEVHCMGIGLEEECQGSVLFISRAGNPPGPERLVETLLRQTGAFLLRVKENLKES